VAGVVVAIAIAGAARAQVTQPPPPHALLELVQCSPTDSCAKYAETSRPVRVTWHPTGIPTTVLFQETTVGYFDNWKVSFWLTGGNDPAAFDYTYVSPATSIFALYPALSILVEVQGSSGAWTSYTSQDHRPVAQALWSVHSMDSQGLQAAIDGLAATAATETSSRKAGDGALQGQLDAEAAARLSGDATLAASLSGEAARAQAAEGSLSSQLGEALDALAAESTRAGAAESVLGDQIAAEAARATAAETQLGRTVNGVPAESFAGAKTGQVLAFTSSGAIAPASLPTAAATAALPGPLQIATLRWWTDRRQLAMPIGAGPSHPTFAAFDGAYVWVANPDRGEVIRLRASDGSRVSSHSVQVPPDGKGPFGVAFDGINIWASLTNSPDQSYDLVTRLRASDGAFMGQYGVAIGPGPMTFDGRNLWVGCRQFTSPFGRFACRVDTDNPDPFLATSCFETTADALAFDGTSVWVAATTENSISKLAIDGQVLGTYTVFRPFNLAFDGSSIWVAGQAVLTRFRASDGARLDSYPVPGGDPDRLAFDGTSMWVTIPDTGLNNQSADRVARYRVSDGALIGTYSTASPQYPSGNLPLDVVFDGVGMWVVNRGTDTLFRL
jgi:hypothetical protein